VTSASVHPLAVVEDGAVLGEGTSVWHHAHVRSGAVVGSGCNIGKNVYIDAGVTVGDRVKVQNNVSLYHGVTIGDDVFLGPSCVFTNDLHPRASNGEWTVTPTHIGRGASIGANATVVCGSSVGEWAAVGAGAVVTRSVEPYQLVYGNPARPHGWVCRCGKTISRVAERPAVLTCGSCEQDAE
jgi:UDP-2-acetamido-3-amino-2,3-dideoxy-glucuronate N-acetyltransferase